MDNLATNNQDTEDLFEFLYDFQKSRQSREILKEMEEEQKRAEERAKERAARFRAQMCRRHRRVMMVKRTLACVVCVLAVGTGVFMLCNGNAKEGEAKAAETVDINDMNTREKLDYIATETSEKEEAEKTDKVQSDVKTTTGKTFSLPKNIEEIARESVEQATEQLPVEQRLKVTEKHLELLGWDEDARSQETIDELNRVIVKYNLDETLEGFSHFIANVSVEIGAWYGYNLTEKYNGDPDEYFKKVSGGKKYRGAGLIHLTHDYTYEAFREYIKETTGKDDKKITSVGYKHVAENYAAEAAGWFFAVYKKGLKELADGGGSVREVRKIVNGGTNGVDKCQEYYDKALVVFAPDFVVAIKAPAERVTTQPVR